MARNSPAVDESGFSLLEMLFVLMIVMLIAFIAMPVMHKVYTEKEIDNFFTVLDADIQLLQNQALEGNDIYIYLRENHYDIKNRTKGYQRRREYPREFNSQVFTEPRIEFWNTGTVKNPKSYFFYDQYDRRYKVVFPLGKGRQYIEGR